jgi:hypothetical protein
LEEEHEARQESRHVMNMTPNDPRTQRQRANLQGLNQKTAKLGCQAFNP